jgi:Zn-dependent peptidase ImmA (M78 family)
LAAAPILMLLILDKISRLRCQWNKRALTEGDFYKLCKRRRITVVEMPLRTSGFYYCVLGRHYIALDSRLPNQKKLFVMFHEFAHYLMHAPDAGVTANFHGVGKKTRKEAEADAFALCAIIPKTWIESRTVYEIIDDEGIPEAILKERLSLYETRGI